MLFCSEYQDVRLYTHTLKLLYAMLSRLGFKLSCSLKIRHVCQVYIQGILTEFPFQLSDSFHIWCTLNVAYSTTYFRYHKVVATLLSQEFHVAFNLVGDVWNYLYGLSQVVAMAFLVNYCLVNPTSSQRIRLCGLNVCEPLIVSEVKVCFHTVHSHIAFSMLVWVQRARINIDVRVKLLDGDIVASCLKKLTNRRRNNSLAERGNYTTRNENVLSFSHFFIYLCL